jgi:hypothetical protein
LADFPRKGYENSPYSGDTAYAVGVSPDGTMVFVTGTANDGGESWLTIAYKA